MAIGALAILDPELEAWQAGKKLVIIPDSVKPLPPETEVHLQYDFMVSGEDKKLSGAAFHRRFFDPAAAFFAIERNRLQSVTEPVIITSRIPAPMLGFSSVRSTDGRMTVKTGFDLTVGGDYGTIRQIVKVRQRAKDPVVKSHLTVESW